MKKIFSFLFCLASAAASAQSPQGIPYQAIARNASGVAIANTAVKVRFSIRDSIATGAIKYQETHNLTTSALGLFSVNVGMGTVVSGTFSGINWGKNAKFLQVELDPAGGTTYTDLGTTQMMSVPYALFAGIVSENQSTNRQLKTKSNIVLPINPTIIDSVTISKGQFLRIEGKVGLNSSQTINSIGFSIKNAQNQPILMDGWVQKFTSYSGTYHEAGAIVGSSGWGFSNYNTAYTEGIFVTNYLSNSDQKIYVLGSQSSPAVGSVLNSITMMVY